ncbi:MAG: Sir2 family NAD-dependent protein deacetylase [Methyloversatilis sp.]|jgi:NAD-dependent SIR2 family protein deacetylase|nr:Sir2 family NAD-dependent protein deacetylase [Methyloversatilis sp.]
MELIQRINILAQWMFDAEKLVVFTGAGISTESGLSDFRGPDGLWTRKARGLPAKAMDWSAAEPNEGHMAIVELQDLNKLKFLISQNVDNLHLKSGIRIELLAELHGNITKIRCTRCGFKMDNFNEPILCPECGGEMVTSVVDFGQPLPEKDFNDAIKHSHDCDLFLVIGSSLVVYPAADMPELAKNSGARLVIINEGETPLDNQAHLRFNETISSVLPPAVNRLKQLLKSA